MLTEQKKTGSKCNTKLPHLYHAQRLVMDTKGDPSIDWFADTFCAICKHLIKAGESPADISIYECFNGHDKVMPKQAYMDRSGNWLEKQDLCGAHLRYGSTDSATDCLFLDRELIKVICW